MKKHDVPQDDEGLQEGKFRDMCYAVDENGNYVTVLSTGWTPKNAALQQAWDEINEKVEEARLAVLEGKRSILAWHMERNIMAIKLLSQYTGIPRRKIKKHLKPEIFDQLEEETLRKYAEVFKLSVEEFTNQKTLQEAK